MLVVKFDASPGAGARPFTDWMSVVETQQALAVTTVQRQRVVQTTRFLRYGRNSFHLELDPGIAFHHECLAIEQQERIETRIVVHRSVYYHLVITSSSSE